MLRQRSLVVLTGLALVACAAAQFSTGAHQTLFVRTAGLAMSGAMS